MRLFFVSLKLAQVHGARIRRRSVAMRKALLLGAGFSFDLGMPLASELTEVFKTLFPGHVIPFLTEMMCSQNPYGEGRPTSSNAIESALMRYSKFSSSTESNYEAFLLELQTAGDSCKTQSERDSYHFVFGFFYDIIFSILCEYQESSHAIVYDDSRANYAGLPVLLNESLETWVFTLNHDLYFEMLGIDLGIDVTYGDHGTIRFPLSNVELNDLVDFTSANRDGFHLSGPGWIRGTAGVNLVRLHGGLCELKYRDGALLCNPRIRGRTSSDLMGEFRRINRMGYVHDGKRIPSGRSRVVTGPDGELDILEMSMLTGGKKYGRAISSKPGEEKISLFQDVLATIDELTIVGYGFGDVHINDRIVVAMSRSEKLRVRIVDPFGPACPAILEPFNYGERVRGARCSAPEWMSYLKNDETWDSQHSANVRKSAMRRSEVQARVLASFASPAPTRLQSLVFPTAMRLHRKLTGFVRR